MSILTNTEQIKQKGKKERVLWLPLHILGSENTDAFLCLLSLVEKEIVFQLSQLNYIREMVKNYVKVFFLLFFNKC